MRTKPIKTRWAQKLSILVGILMAGAAYGTDFASPGMFPQFRSMSGLPGSGFGVLPSGKLSFSGAMAFSTPIAYSMTGWDVVVGGAILSDDRSLQFIENTASLDGNGSAQIVLGIPLGSYGDATVTQMFLSKRLDSAQNLQWAPPGQTGPVRFGLGVQDITSQAGTRGVMSKFDESVHGESRSYFVAGTWQASPDLYITLGTGDTRFKGRIFGSMSYNVHEKVKLLVEHDVFNWNTAIAIDLGTFGGVRKDRPAQLTTMLGFVAGDSAYWSLNLSF